MTTRNMKWRNATAMCLAVATLTACGESDLVDLNTAAYQDGIGANEVPAAASPVTVDLSQYDLVFSDEFNGATLDDRKWGTAPLSPDTIVYDQLQYYVDSQNSAETFDSPFSFDGEHLTIAATMTPQGQEANANGQAYLSGLLTTRDQFDLTYGYVEARVQVTEGRGIWPAVWMLGSESDGLRPEVYILEYDGSKPDNAYQTYIYLDQEGTLRSPGQQETLVNGFSEGFHTVGLRWSAGELLFFVDGRAIWRVVGENVPSEDMHLILNLAMGGIWPGAPDGTTPDPALLVVDYVRIYQLSNP